MWGYMTRKARIDAPGASHQIIVRGIERRRIFSDDQDRDNFVEHLGDIVTETQKDKALLFRRRRIGESGLYVKNQ
jgi:hypothetical protein